MDENKKRAYRDVSVQLRCIRRLILQVQDDIGDLCIGEKDDSILDKQHDSIVKMEYDIDQMSQFFGRQ